MAGVPAGYEEEWSDDDYNFNDETYKDYMKNEPSQNVFQEEKKSAKQTESYVSFI